MEQELAAVVGENEQLLQQRMALSQPKYNVLSGPG